MRPWILPCVLLSASVLPLSVVDAACSGTEILFVETTPFTYVYLVNCNEQYGWTYATPGSVGILGCGSLPEVRVLGNPVPGTGSNCSLGPLPSTGDSGQAQEQSTYVCVAAQSGPTCLKVSVLEPGCYVGSLLGSCYYITYTSPDSVLP